MIVRILYINYIEYHILLAYNISKFDPNNLNTNNCYVLHDILTSKQKNFKPFLVNFLKEISPNYTLDYRPKQEVIDDNTNIINTTEFVNHDKESKHLKETNCEKYINEEHIKNENINSSTNFYTNNNWNDVLNRGLSLKISSLNNKEELSDSIKNLLDYICKMNNFPPVIRWKDIEDTIESDFLNTKFR